MDKKIGKTSSFHCANSRKWALELGARCLISETFLYLSGMIHLIAWCLVGEVIWYDFGVKSLDKQDHPTIWKLIDKLQREDVEETAEELCARKCCEKTCHGTNTAASQ